MSVYVCGGSVREREMDRQTNRDRWKYRQRQGVRERYIEREILVYCVSAQVPLFN